MIPEKPFSQACENNKTPILQKLRDAFAGVSQVLELASGTGQHACYFASHLPHLKWQPSDLEENLPGIKAWIADSAANNIEPPLPLDVCQKRWPVAVSDGVFSANSLHIMSWAAVQKLFEYLALYAPEENILCIYGPFNYGGKFTSDSNADFNRWLQARDPLSGIRDFEAVDALAIAAGYVLQNDYAMPANNRLLVWQKGSTVVTRA